MNKNEQELFEIKRLMTESKRILSEGTATPEDALAAYLSMNDAATTLGSALSEAGMTDFLHKKLKSACINTIVDEITDVFSSVDDEIFDVDALVAEIESELDTELASAIDTLEGEIENLCIEHLGELHSTVVDIIERHTSG